MILCTTITDVFSAVSYAGITGYPVVVKPHFTINGQGYGTAMNEEELRGLVRLTCLAEECAEVIHAVCKAQRHGLESEWDGMVNRIQLAVEMGQLAYLTSMLLANGDVGVNDYRAGKRTKSEKLRRYTHHQLPEVFDLADWVAFGERAPAPAAASPYPTDPD